LLHAAAGAIVDIVEPSRYLIVLETSSNRVSSSFAAMAYVASRDAADAAAADLVLFEPVGSRRPPWATLTPLSRAARDLEAAAAANSIGYNRRPLGRAVDRGRLITRRHPSPRRSGAFAVANAASVVALLMLKPPPRRDARLAGGRLLSAVRAGVRPLRYNPPCARTLARTVRFLSFAADLSHIVSAGRATRMTSACNSMASCWR